MIVANDPRARVAIVTVGFNSDPDLAEMVISAEDAASFPVVGVIVDNASTSSTRQIAENSGFSYFALPNPGYGAAVNVAVQALPPQVEWVVVANPDVRFTRHSIDEMVEVAQSDDSIAAVGPRILDENGSIYPSARAIPSLRTGVGHALLGALRPNNRWTKRYLRIDESQSSENFESGWLSGACLLVRRAAFESIGGFDGQYFMYFEDVDLGFRLGRAGWRSIYAPNAVVVHIGGTSTAAVSRQMTQVHHRSAALFLARRYPGRAFSPLRLVLRCGLRLRSLLFGRLR